ncbi:hypothetical protein ABK040_012211 [Willaertia magna]
MSSNLPSCVIEPLVESTNLFLNNNENFGLAFFADKHSYLIKKLDKHLEIKIFRNGIFILNKLTGHVYFQSVHNKEIKKLENFGMIFDKEIHLLKFTIEDPIKQIITKYSNYFAMISKSGNAYLFSLDNDLKQGLIPKYLFEDEKIVQIACGGVHVLYLTENNTLFGTGSDYDGSLSSYNEFGLFHGTTNEFGVLKCNVEALKGKKIKQIAATYNCSFALTVDNELYSCGSCTYAVNGQPKEMQNCLFFTKVKDNVELVIAGYFFAAIKTLNGEYYIFGYNNCNQFGRVDSDLMVGNKIYGTTTKLNTFNIHDIEQLECGGYHSIIVSKSNDVYFSGNSHCNVFPDCFEFTKIDFSKYITNWNNVQKSSKIKVETGYDFTLIYNENHKKNIFNFNNAYKISDITIHF